MKLANGNYIADYLILPIKTVPKWVTETLQRDNFKCTKCSTTNSLIVHHLDESRKNGPKNMNNNFDNLITVCRPCHAILHNLTLRFTNVRKTFILELRSNGMTYQKISNYLGISRQRVYQILKKGLYPIKSS